MDKDEGRKFKSRPLNHEDPTITAIRLDGGFFVWNYCRYVKMRNARRRHSLLSAWLTLIYWDLA